MTRLPRSGSIRRAPSSRQALFFRLGDARLALPAEQVTEVTEVDSCTHIPTPDPALVGVARIGRRLLPVIDAHRRMRVNGSPSRPFPWTCVVVKGAHGEVAFRIDEILGLRSVADGQLPVGYAAMQLEQVIEGDETLAAGSEG